MDSLDSEASPDSASDAVVSLAAARTRRMAKPVTFDRRELQTILNLYGRRVAEGEWRDYAIAFSPAKAVFAIFRRTAETPLYTIEKNPALARKQGAYCVVASSGQILKRGADLARVLSAIDKPLKVVR
ncbi:MAG: DUF2794 domain-containing protein [Hyphomicrobiales bacterium]|nr:DUF2794 domain-containing protein [Hyphomicrobiales bacterium]